MIDRERLVALLASAQPFTRWAENEDLADAILALPVTVTEEMAERAWAAFSRSFSDARRSRRPTYSERQAIHAALEAALNPREPGA